MLVPDVGRLTGFFFCVKMLAGAFLRSGGGPLGVGVTELGPDGGLDGEALIVCDWGGGLCAGLGWTASSEGRMVCREGHVGAVTGRWS